MRWTRAIPFQSWCIFETHCNLLYNKQMKEVVFKHVIYFCVQASSVDVYTGLQDGLAVFESFSCLEQKRLIYAYLRTNDCWPYGVGTRILVPFCYHTRKHGLRLIVVAIHMAIDGLWFRGALAV